MFLLNLPCGLNIRQYYTEPGPGGYAARNLGIEKVKGEWVAFLDADDEWYPNHLEKMHELAQKYPNVYFMSCGWQTQNNSVKKENAFYKELKEKDSLRITVEEYLKFALKKKLPVCSSVASVKKTSPIATNLFPADIGAKRGGDLHAWLKMICHHKQMAWSNHIGAVYHLDSINMVTKSSVAVPILYSNSIYQTFAKQLNLNEQELLKKYFNYKITFNWVENLIHLKRNFSLYHNIKGNFFVKVEYLLLKTSQNIISRIISASLRKMF